MLCSVAADGLTGPRFAELLKELDSYEEELGETMSCL